MPLVLVGDQINVTFAGSFAGQTCLNNFGYQVTAIGGAHQVVTTAGEINNKLSVGGGMIDDYAALLPGDYIINELWVQWLRPTRYAKQKFISGVTGANPGNSTSTNQAITITRKGFAANRRNIGGVHIFCVNDDSAMLDGEFLAAYKLLAATFAVHMSSTVALFGDGTIITPSIIPTDPGGAVIPVVSTEVQGTARVMRRRTVGLGI